MTDPKDGALGLPSVYETNWQAWDDIFASHGLFTIEELRRQEEAKRVRMNRRQRLALRCRLFMLRRRWDWRNTRRRIALWIAPELEEW